MSGTKSHARPSSNPIPYGRFAFAVIKSSLQKEKTVFHLKIEAGKGFTFSEYSNTLTENRISKA